MILYVQYLYYSSYHTHLCKSINDQQCTQTSRFCSFLSRVIPKSPTCLLAFSSNLRSSRIYCNPTCPILAAIGLVVPFRPVVMPTASPSCQRTSTGMRNLTGASGPISPCPSAGQPPPREAASSDRPAGPSAPACYRTRLSAGSTPTVKNE